MYLKKLKSSQLRRVARKVGIHVTSTDRKSDILKKLMAPLGHYSMMSDLPPELIMTRSDQDALETDIKNLEIALQNIEADIKDAMKRQDRDDIKKIMKTKQEAVSYLTKLRQLLKSNLEKMGAVKLDSEICAICTQSLFECPDNEAANQTNQDYYDKMKRDCCYLYKCTNYFTVPSAQLRQPNAGVLFEDEQPNLPQCNRNLSEPNQCWVSCLSKNSKCKAKFHKLCMARYLIIDAPSYNPNSRNTCPNCRKTISQKVKNSLIKFLKNTDYPNSELLKNKKTQLTLPRNRSSTRNRLWSLGLGLTAAAAVASGLNSLNHDLHYLDVPANSVPCSMGGDYLENRTEYCDNYLNMGYSGLNSHYNLGIGTWYSIRVPTRIYDPYFIPSGRLVTDNYGNPISYKVDITSDNMNPTKCVKRFGEITCYEPDGGVYNP